jgi:hypothetical protein
MVYKQNLKCDIYAIPSKGGLMKSILKCCATLSPWGWLFPCGLIIAVLRFLF